MKRSFTHHAFTLIELVVVVLILGIIAAIAVPSIVDTASEARAAAELENARRFLSGVERYKGVHGELPRDGAPGKFPKDLDGFVAKSLFNGASPSGGLYDWDGPPPHSAARLKIVYPAGTDIKTTDLYLKMEELADDGSWKTGWITGNGRFLSFWY